MAVCEVVQFSSQFGNDTGTRIRAAVAADQQHGHECGIPAGQKREVGAIRLHGLNHSNHVRDFSGGILDSHNAFTFFRQPLNGGDVDGTGKHWNIVERHINRRVVADFLKVRVNAGGT